MGSLIFFYFNRKDLNSKFIWLDEIIEKKRKISMIKKWNKRSANFIKQNCKLSFIEENIIFGLITDIRREVFSNNTMPISAIFLVELLFDMFRHEVLNFDIIDSIFSLWIKEYVTYFIASAIMSELSGISTIESFEMTSAICIFITFLCNVSFEFFISCF